MPRKTSHNSGSASAKSNGTTAAHMGIARRFGLFAQEIARLSGRPLTFLLAVLVVIVWAVTGPLFHYSDTWQLVINTGTTIVTFLMVFLIQNTQNRDTLAIQLKLSELILAMKGAPNSFATIEDLSDEELEALHDDCRLRAEMAFAHLQKRRAHKVKSRRPEPAGAGRGEIGQPPSPHVAGSRNKVPT